MFTLVIYETKSLSFSKKAYWPCRFLRKGYMKQAEYDVVVIGGGPCGSTLSTLVALSGKKVLLLEKERFPRYQIGESLLPSTVHGICRLLGVFDKIENAGFMRKLGGSFRWGS